MDFYESNSDRDNICFLIKLDLEEEIKLLVNITQPTSSIQVQNSSDVITDDFHPPPNINFPPIDEVRGYDDYNLTLTFPPNPFVIKVETKIYALSDLEGPKDARWVILSCCHDR